MHDSFDIGNQLGGEEEGVKSRSFFTNPYSKTFTIYLLC